MAPPPPAPLIQGSSTPRAKVVAITASTQSPPAASTSAPTSAALRDCAATMPPFEVTAGLRITCELENWSDMALLPGVVFAVVVAGRERWRSMPSMAQSVQQQAYSGERKMTAVKRERDGKVGILTLN